MLKFNKMNNKNIKNFFFFLNKKLKPFVFLSISFSISWFYFKTNSKKKETKVNTIQYNTIKGLACTFRASRYSACLSWALVLNWVSPFVQHKNLAVWVWEESRLSRYDIRAAGALPPSITVIARV